jgi:hypothetical protein
MRVRYTPTESEEPLTGSDDGEDTEELDETELAWRYQVAPVCLCQGPLVLSQREPERETCCCSCARTWCCGWMFDFAVEYSECFGGLRRSVPAGSAHTIFCHQFWCIQCVGRESTFTRRTYCVAFLPVCFLGLLCSILVDLLGIFVVVLIALAMGIGLLLLLCAFPVIFMQGFIIVVVLMIIASLCRSFTSFCFFVRRGLDLEGGLTEPVEGVNGSDSMEQRILQSISSSREAGGGLPV